MIKLKLKLRAADGHIDRRDEGKTRLRRASAGGADEDTHALAHDRESISSP